MCDCGMERYDGDGRVCPVCGKPLGEEPFFPESESFVELVVVLVAVAVCVLTGLGVGLVINMLVGLFTVGR